MIRRSWKFHILILTMSLVGPPNAYAETYALFKGGIVNPDYRSILENLKPGDIVQFSNGASFEVGPGLMIFARTSTFIRTNLGRLLRVPSLGNDELRNYLERYNNGYKTLVDHGISVPTRYSFFGSEYAEHDHLKIVGLLSDWISTGDIHSLQSEALKKFLRSTYAFFEIGDFNETQVAWDGERWFLIDWLDTHILFSRSRLNLQTKYTESAAQYLARRTPASDKKAWLMDIHFQIATIREGDCDDQLVNSGGLMSTSAFGAGRNAGFDFNNRNASSTPRDN